MLIPSLVFLTIVYLRAGDRRSPLRLYCLVWLGCMLPSIAGLLTYRLDTHNQFFSGLVLLAFNVAFVLGYWCTDHRAPSGTDRPNFAAEAVRRLDVRALWFATACAAIGTALITVDYLYFRPFIVDDLGLARTLFVDREANALEQASSLVNWGALYLLGYVVVFMPALPWWRTLAYSIPAVALFVTGLASAGRQAAFQILIVIVAALIFRKNVLRTRARMTLVGRLIIAGLAVAIIGYMGYIGSAREDVATPVNKTRLLEDLFRFDLSPQLENRLNRTDPAVRDGVVEGLVYFNSPVNLFSVFLSVDRPKHYFGMLTFPFLARRLEWVYGQSVVSAMAEGADRITSAGVIGVGWFTSYWTLIADFGYIGAAILLFITGLLSRMAWEAFKQEPCFASFAVLLSACITIVYLPLLPAVSDTNILFLTAFSCFMWHLRKRLGKSNGGGSSYAAQSGALI
jgi:hypothetical protein